jgi:trans-aconitate 2-methyltransferase
MAWDPHTYLTYADHRTRPAAELLARIRIASPQLVYDLGCGPGNSTALLRKRWPRARIVGVDNSPAMLERAARDGPQADWREADLANFVPETPADLLFSNAAYHWVDRHDTVFPELVAALNPGGALAVQMPANFDAPSHVLLRRTAANGPWAATLQGTDRVDPVAAPEVYYQRLSGLARDLDIWSTEYLQCLDGADPVLNWVKGTALVPYLSRLDEEMAAAFLAAYGARLRAAYPPEGNGVTLFPFRRLFLIAYR